MDRDIGAQPAQFADVKKALLEQGFGDGAGALRYRQQCHGGGLEIGREARIGLRDDVDADKALRRPARQQSALDIAQVDADGYYALLNELYARLP